MKRRFSFFSESFSTYDEEVLELEKGRFHARCRSCTGANPTFSKEGYYSETLSFQVKQRPTEESNRTDQEVEDLNETDLRVVLRSAENMARLVRYVGRLRTSSDGVMTVMALRRDLGANGTTLDRLIEPPSSEARLVGGYVQMRVATTEDGQLAARPDSN